MFIDKGGKQVKKKLYNIKLLTKLMYEYSKLMPLMLILRVIFQALLPLAKLIFSSQVIAWLIRGMDLTSYLIQLVVWLAGLSIVSMLNTHIKYYFESHKETFRIDIMDRINEKFLTIDYPQLVGKVAQEIFAKASRLISTQASLFGRFFKEIEDLLSALLAGIIYIQLLVQLEIQFVWLISLTIIALIVFKLFSERLEKRIKEPTANLNKRRTYLNRLFGDVRVAKDIRLYQMREWFGELEVNLEEEANQIIKPKVHFTWLESSSISVLTVILTGMAFIRSTQLIGQGVLNVDEFVVYVGTVTLLSGTLTQLINASADFNHSLIEVTDYTNFMEQEPVFNHDKGIQLDRSQPLSIELRDVSYSYPNSTQATLRNISMNISSGENLAIVGENGAGKSTLIKLILGLLKPDEGKILINGIEQSEFNINDYYNLFSPVFQDIYLLTYTIKETVLQGLAYEPNHYQWVMKQSGMDEIASQYELGDETKLVRTVYQDAVTLSGGQMQKLKLAQALYKNSPILILDEPTAALDPIAENKVYQDYLTFSEAKTSLFISHRLSSTRFCDRIIYLKKGEITEIGQHDDLMDNRRDYFKLFEAQAHYYREENNETETEEQIEIGGVI